MAKKKKATAALAASRRGQKNSTTAKGKIREPQFLSVLLKRRKNPGAMKKLIDLADKNEVDAISEIVLNAYRGNITLSPSLVQHLARNRRASQRLLDRNVSLLEKKRILKNKQVGGFIGAILGALGSLVVKPILGLIVNKIASKRKKR